MKMNSVFSAFKTSKNDGKQKQASKKLTPDSSYENLKHIRDIGSSSKMTDFVDDTDGKLVGGVATQIIRLNTPSSIGDEINDSSADVVDHAKTVIVDYIENYHPINKKSLQPTESADACTSVQPDRLVENEQTETKLNSCQTNEQTVTKMQRTDLSDESNHTPQLPPSGPMIKVPSSTSTNENQQVPIIVSNNVNDTNSITNKAKRFQHRLSLKCNPNPTLPSVHGRATSNSSDTKKKSRLSTHQRNLSLDFRYVLINEREKLCRQCVANI